MATQYAQIADMQNLGAAPEAFLTLDNTTKNAALLSASEFIDSFLRSKFLLPLTQFGQDIVQACVDVAVWRLFSRRGYNPDAPADQEIRARYKDTVEWLKLVAKGEVTPDLTDSTPGGAQSEPFGEATTTSSSQRGWSSRGSNAPGSSFDGTTTDDPFPSGGGAFGGN